MLKKINSTNIRVYVLWTPAYGTDNTEWTQKGMKIFQDKRVTQFWDSQQQIALHYGKSITLPRDAPIAYDVYFYFKKGIKWEEQAPLPTDYMHQAGDDARWFEPKKFTEWVLKAIG